MATRALPPNVAVADGASVIDAKEYLRLARDVLASVDADALDAAGQIAYAQARALVAIGARARYLEGIPDLVYAVTGLATRGR